MNRITAVEALGPGPHGERCQCARCAPTLDELKPLIEAVLQEALDDVEECCHPCDRSNEAIKARHLSESMKALYKAMRGNRNE